MLRAALCSRPLTIMLFAATLLVGSVATANPSDQATLSARQAKKLYRQWRLNTTGANDLHEMHFSRYADAKKEVWKSVGAGAGFGALLPIALGLYAPSAKVYFAVVASAGAVGAIGGALSKGGIIKRLRDLKHTAYRDTLLVAQSRGMAIPTPLKDYFNIPQRHTESH